MNESAVSEWSFNLCNTILNIGDAEVATSVSESEGLFYKASSKLNGQLKRVECAIVCYKVSCAEFNLMDTLPIRTPSHTSQSSAN